MDYTNATSSDGKTRFLRVLSVNPVEAIDVSELSAMATEANYLSLSVLSPQDHADVCSRQHIFEIDAFEIDALNQTLEHRSAPCDSQRVTHLEAELAALRVELEQVKHEKADLEILLEATAEHSDFVEAELHSTAIAALKQSEEMFRTIAEATPVPVLISRPESGEILYANDSTSQVFGVSKAELLSRSTLEFYVDPGDRQRLLKQVQDHGSVQNIEVQCRRADGDVLWVAASLQQLMFNDEVVILSALCDITQRKAEADALRRQMEAMQVQIDQAKLEKHVAEIVQSDYFQEIQAEVEQLRCPRDPKF